MYQNLLLLGITTLFTVSAHLFLKKGVLSLKDLDFSIGNFLNLIVRILQNFWLVGGMFLIAISFISWLFFISRVKLNLAYPLATSVNVILIVFFSWLLLKEQLLPIQIFGIATIIFGIFLLLKP